MVTEDGLQCAIITFHYKEGTAMFNASTVPTDPSPGQLKDLHAALVQQAPSSHMSKKEVEFWLANKRLMGSRLRAMLRGDDLPLLMKLGEWDHFLGMVLGKNCSLLNEVPEIPEGCLLEQYRPIKIPFDLNMEKIFQAWEDLGFEVNFTSSGDSSDARNLIGGDHRIWVANKPSTTNHPLATDFCQEGYATLAESLLLCLFECWQFSREWTIQPEDWSKISKPYYNEFCLGTSSKSLGVPRILINKGDLTVIWEPMSDKSKYSARRVITS